MVGLGQLAKKLFGSPNDRQLRSFSARVDAINALESEFAPLCDDALKAKTAEFRAELAAGRALDDLLIPAFATVREASKRTLQMRHFDVQLIGGMVLHEGKIAEMKTGEGKTLVATLPIYLNALAGEGVHSVTVNDYLAQRDAAWMGQIYAFLGLSVGVIVHGLDDEQRKAAYACDITYGTNNELGFDYLRDNMKHDLQSMAQRKHKFAIVDEVDSILVDEARTPLIISGPLADRSEFYTTIDTFIPQLTETHYEIDEKQRTASFTEEGNEQLEALLSEAGLLKGASLYDMENVTVVHHLQQALRAHKMFQKDKDYIVRNGEVVLIDEFTGRMMPGRRYSEGLHQAIEAREGVAIQPENQTLASITFQNYFRGYEKLAGMTGTAATEAEEFGDIYGLQVVEIPTNKVISRKDEDDEVYRTAEEKYNAIIEQIEDCHERNQPVLVGTTSIEKSEFLAELLKKKGFKQRDFAALYDGNKKQRVFQVLNARYHEQEAQIIAQAGIPGAVTIATNMAGRGTDIQLGGNADVRIAAELQGADDPAKIEAIKADIAALKEKALAAGGLYVIGTERHESRRIDNQLRGRSGRQGDPGHSKFYLSLQDDLMRIFGSERMDGILKRFGLQEGEAIVHPWINKSLETAQKKVEARNFDARKNILKYDDVMNDQRKVIFEQRIELMSDEDVSGTITDMRHEVIEDLIARYIPEKAYADEWDIEGLSAEVATLFGEAFAISDWAKEEGIANEEMLDRLRRAVDEKAALKAINFGDKAIRYVEKTILLQTLDHLWREHLATLDDLRSVIGFRGYGQRDPLNEYKSEAFTLFEGLLANLRVTVTQNLFRVQLVTPEQQAALALAAQRNSYGASLPVEGAPAPAETAGPETGSGTAQSPDATNMSQQISSTTVRATRPARREPGDRDPNDPASWGKVGRNEPCPCGSGKKYKHCHGALV